MATLLQDLRHGIRSLAKNPGFAGVAVVVLALGIGVNTAIFSIVNAVFFRTLPVHAPEELAFLYRIYRDDRPPSIIFSREFLFLKQHVEGFAGLTAHWGFPARLNVDGDTETVAGESVFANYFDVLGVKPHLGRTFSPDEDRQAAAGPAVVISHSLWQRVFRSDPAIVGKEIRLSQKVCTIVGVMGPDFKGVSDPWTPSHFWVPLVQWLGDEYPKISMGVYPIARLKSGVTLKQAQAMLSTVAEHLPGPGDSRLGNRYLALPAERVRLPFDPNGNIVPNRLAAALLAVVGMVLVIASANIAGILLARGVARAGEMAVRLALGAGRLRIMCQSLTESVLLSALGGVSGMLIAHILLGFFHAMTPVQFALEVPLDIRVLSFTAAACLCAGLLIGLAPALQATRVDVVTALSGGGVVAHKQVRSRLRQWVVIPQVGLSLLLLLVAGLYVKDLARIELSDLGYTTDDLTVLNATLRESPAEAALTRNDPARSRIYAERSRAYYRRLLDHLVQLPDAAAVALVENLPLYSGNTRSETVTGKEDYLTGSPGGVSVSRTGVSPGYFRCMGIALKQGRDFDERDSYQAPRVAVISEALSNRLWPGRNPIGRSLGFFSPERPDAKVDWLEVVGVVADVSPIVHEKAENPLVYVPLSQQWRVSGNNIVARSRGNLAALVDGLKKSVSGSDPHAEIYRVRTMGQIVAEILYPRRLATAILTAAALVGLLLAGIGIYGVVSHSVAQRVREIGIRSALGASRKDIMTLVLGEGAWVALVGSVLGLALSCAATRIASWYVAPIPAIDPFTLAGVPIFLATVILLACYIPARRAARVDPMAALREL